MDELKKYLDSNRDDLDTDMPGDMVWHRLERSMIPAKKKPVVRFLIIRLTAAAAILLLVLGGIKWVTNNNATESTGSTAGNSNPLHPGLLMAKNSSLKTNNPVKEPVVYTNKLAQKKKTGDPSIAFINSLRRDYTQVVNLQINSIRSTPVYGEGPEYFEAFKTGLKQMDATEAGIRNQIRKRGLTDDLLGNLIDVYQQKLDMLKELKNEIRKMNERTKQSNEPASTSPYYLNI